MFLKVWSQDHQLPSHPTGLLIIQISGPHPWSESDSLRLWFRNLYYNNFLFMYRLKKIIKLENNCFRSYHAFLFDFGQTTNLSRIQLLLYSAEVAWQSLLEVVEFYHHEWSNSLPWGSPVPQPYKMVCSNLVWAAFGSPGCHMDTFKFRSCLYYSFFFFSFLYLIFFNY